ncbi:dynein regulatory complex subunit 7 [Penaeus vannamei]|uniref:dynein regulatory complex subunit 7 n=1 Tax=Penaeus vannamei TaxID=6689 RepID=UPI00387F8BDD
MWLDELRRKPDKGSEEALLNHVASFRRRYNSYFPLGPLLLLTPKNEENEMKSIVSFVVPSLVPYSQLLELESAAQVLADLITYLPPSLPPSLPETVRSPSFVVDLQEGSGVECALVTASILLGAGYRALVVQGAADLSLVAADTSSLPCPYLQREEESLEAEEDTRASKYTVRPPPDLRSRYVAIMEERERRRRLAEEEAAKEEVQVEEAEGGASPADAASHLHFWVLVLPPNRDVTTPTVVEPTNGQVIPLSPAQNPPYRQVHAVFDHTNYWASVRYDSPVSSDMFDLSDRSLWFPLIDDRQTTRAKGDPPPRLPAPSSPGNGVSQAPAGDQQPLTHSGGEGSSREGSGGKVGKRRTSSSRVRSADEVRVPKSWAKTVCISEEALRQRFPGGWREERYQGAVVRRYSPFSHPRGATLVLTLYSEDDEKPREIREQFEQRKDGLESRVTDLVKGDVVETFAKSRQDTLKRHQYWVSPSVLASRTSPDGLTKPSKDDSEEEQQDGRGEEVFMFHSKFRVDALRSRIIGGGVWREEFDERADLLLARTVTFTPTTESGTAPNRSIQRIEEEYGQPEGTAPHEAVQRRVLQVAEGRILLVYHYGHHRLLQPTRSFVKPPSSDGRAATLSPEMTHGFQPDPTVEEPPMPQLWAVLRAEMEAEAVSQEEVRRGVEETAQVREARAREEEDPALVTHIFDIHRNETVQFILRQRQYDEAHREETLRKKREEREGKVDIVAPYIPLLTSDAETGGPETVRERCLQDLRERLALRANLLQDRLDQARAAVLECRDEAGRRKRLTADERAALTGRTAAAEASHRRLRAQLAAWKHEASERYDSLAGQLEVDPRFALDLGSQGASSADEEDESASG